MLVLSHDRRRELHCRVVDCGVTAHPTSAWTASRLLAASKPVIAAIAEIFSKPLSPISVSSMVRLTNAEKGFTDAGFKHLEKPTYRHRIESSGSLDGPPQLRPRQDALRDGAESLDDQGFARLPALPTLESLNIAGTKVTDACLTALQRSSITMSRAHLIKERLRRCPQGVVYGRRGGSFPSVRMSQG